MKTKLAVLLMITIIFTGCSQHNVLIYERDYYYDVSSYTNVTLVTGSFSDLQTCLDNNHFRINEQTGSPALMNNYTFTNVTYFTEIIICQEYFGTHDLHMKIYNNNISQFVSINDIGNTDSINCNYKHIGGSSDPFINNGEVVIQIDHQQNGVNSHYELIDCLRLKV